MVVVGNRILNLKDVQSILFEKKKIILDKKAFDRLERNCEFLKRFSKDKVIYGLNTGFGPMAKYKISPKEQIQLQYNLIRSHSSGTGGHLSGIDVKAVMIARLNSLMKCYSGVNSSVPRLLVEFINRDIYPVIFEHGGVGASGDLVQLSHLTLALIGEGEVTYDQKIFPTRDILERLKLSPITLEGRDGLALINGTSCMTGISLVNAIRAKNLLNWSLVASSMIGEIVSAYTDYFSESLNNVKLHEGQKKIAEIMRQILRNSKLLRDRTRHYSINTSEVQEDRVQERYSLRCVPQILGPVLDTLDNAEKVVVDELNSVSDNPIIAHDEKNIFHGGNFHGDYISLEMDKLKLAVTKLSMLAERQLNLILNDNLNDELPPFVNLGKIGLNLGMQGVQFTATSTVAENQTLSNSMYIHSIPTNADNQDIVSMGTNSALIARKIIENSYEVLAIEFMAILQAIDYLKIQDKLSTCSGETYQKLRKLVPKFVEDTTKYNEIKKLKDYILNNNLKPPH